MWHLGRESWASLGWFFPRFSSLRCSSTGEVSMSVRSHVSCVLNHRSIKKTCSWVSFPLICHRGRGPRCFHGRRRLEGENSGIDVTKSKLVNNVGTITTSGTAPSHSEVWPEQRFLVGVVSVLIDCVWIHLEHSSQDLESRSGRCEAVQIQLSRVVRN